MDQPYSQTLAWYHAITLSERITLLRTTQDTMSEDVIDANIAKKRIHRWRAQPPFVTDAYFAQRLAMDSITEDELFYLLGKPAEALSDLIDIPPSWLAELDQAFFPPVASRRETSPLSRKSNCRALSGILNGIEPLISQGRNRIREGMLALIQNQADLPFDLSTVEDVIFANLPRQLQKILGSTLVLELNVARLQGRLSGDTAEDRFQSFVELMGQRSNALALLQEYPVMARQLKICIDHWVASSLEFIQRLCADWEIIKKLFSPGSDPGVLVEADSSVSDLHRCGRSVHILRFSSGFQLVYKPKPLAVDMHFQQLLTWLNDHGDHPPFRILKVLERGSYGWVEFVAVQGCASAAEVRRFYERQGGYLALLYALEAIDFHSENLVAAGEDPVLLDLEALFHPHIGRGKLEQANQLANSELSHSVLRIGLLPMRYWSHAQSEGIDISGIGAVAGQLTPYDVPRWEGEGTDKMRITHGRVVMPADENRPTLNGSDVDALDYVEAIATGFISIYQLLLKHRQELLSENGPLARFAEDEVRIILRATQTYQGLLQGSFHPDVLRNALDRDCLFDCLWAEIPYSPHLARVIPFEREDLQKGDIPIFTTRVNSRDLWSSAKELISDYFDESGLVLVHRRLQQLSDRDLTKQLWVIRASLATLSPGVNQAKWPTYRLTEPQTVANRERLLAAARIVGDRLEALALHGEQDVAWTGITFSNERRWSLVPLGMDLAHGIPGITLFLAYLGAISREKRFTTLAQAALATMRNQIEWNRSVVTSIGGFHGWGGVIYTLTHLAKLWDQPQLLAEAEAVTEQVLALIEQDEHLDVFAGAAGCIGSLLSLYHSLPSDKTLLTAIECGDWLIAHAHPQECGIGWVIRAAGSKPLTGFSHGAAGMAWALLKLADLTGAERFRAAALDALAYERSLFSPEQKNWPDLRESETGARKPDNYDESFAVAWCHGAPGIGLARLSVLPYLNDAATRAEINAALRTTLAQGFGGNHSLCHGDLGNLELLLQAGQTLNDQYWRDQTNRIAATILENINQNGWLCGIPLGVESPGLMTGLAGIGYELLRLAEPTRVPSVLVLEPPPLQA